VKIVPFFSQIRVAIIPGGVRDIKKKSQFIEEMVGEIPQFFCDNLFKMQKIKENC
jgi:hypothetical protein